MICPHCSSDSISTYTKTATRTKNFDACSACCGYVLFGWIGILCGLCDSGESVSSTRIQHICNDCGKRF